MRQQRDQDQGPEPSTPWARERRAQRQRRNGKQQRQPSGPEAAMGKEAGHHEQSQEHREKGPAQPRVAPGRWQSEQAKRIGEVAKAIEALTRELRQLT
jgi:hypothetical protein